MAESTGSIHKDGNSANEAYSLLLYNSFYLAQRLLTAAHLVQLWPVEHTDKASGRKRDLIAQF